MSAMPISLTISLVGLIVGIGGKLVFLPLGLAGALTLLFAAIALVLYAWIEIKKAPAMITYALEHFLHGIPPTGEKP